MLKFDSESRRHHVLSILNMLREEVNIEQSKFNAVIEEMSLNDGFGYKLKVTQRDELSSAAKLELFYVLHNYIQDMLNYMFNGHIDVSSFSNSEVLELEFQIVSAF